MDISTFLHQRILKLQNFLSPHNIDALFITNPVNFFYLTDYSNADGFILITQSKSYYLIDSRSFLEAKKKVSNLEVLELKSLLTIKELLIDSKIKKPGFEANHITISKLDNLKKHFKGISLVKTKNIIENLRAIKDEMEISRIKKASKISKIAYSKIIENLSEFKIEKDIYSFYENTIKEEGGEGVSFSPIIACGKNSAIPHYSTGLSKIDLNKNILFDLGAIYQGYASDLTRMYFPLKAKKSMIEAYKRISEVKALAISEAKVGVKASYLDKIVRESLEKSGLNKYFTHSLGHSVGLEVHDGLNISQKSDFILKSGMVLTIEPGVYFPDEYGIRLEDMILISKNKAEIL